MVEGRKAEKTILLERVKQDSIDVLKTYGEYQRFHDCDIYVMSPEHIKTFKTFDGELSQYRKDTVKGKAYSIDKIVNLINPDKIAYQFDLTRAEKYVYISTKATCISKANENIEVNANAYRKELEKKITDNPDWSSDFILKIRTEMEEKIEEERKSIKAIEEKPDICKSMRICGFKNKIEYGQVNWGYYTYTETGEKIKNRTNKHISVKYPNIIFFEADEEADKHRNEMEAKYLEEEGYIEISRNVFVKYNDGEYNGKI